MQFNMAKKPLQYNPALKPQQYYNHTVQFATDWFKNRGSLQFMSQLVVTRNPSRVDQQIRPTLLHIVPDEPPPDHQQKLIFAEGTRIVALQLGAIACCTMFEAWVTTWQRLQGGAIGNEAKIEAISVHTFIKGRHGQTGYMPINRHEEGKPRLGKLILFKENEVEQFITYYDFLKPPHDDIVSNLKCLH